MNKCKLDFILCNWPLIGLLIIPISISTNNFANLPILQILISIFFGGGWLIALVYGFYRMAQQKWASNLVIIWVLGLLWFSIISLPWLYWKYLRKNDLRS